jgi:hypothetical protein
LTAVLCLAASALAVPTTNLADPNLVVYEAAHIEAVSRLLNIHFIFYV